MTFYVTFPGDATRISTFGGTPYFITNAINGFGATSQGLDLGRTFETKLRRLLWNGFNVATGRGRGGFQYSDLMLDHLWKKAPAFTKDDTLINVFQLFGKAALRSPARKAFYIDMTLDQLFDFYQLPVSRKIQRMAIAKEKAGYAQVDLVMCKSQWAASSLAETYGVPADRIKVIVPGANVQPALARQLGEIPVSPPGDRLKLLFVGKDSVRKGLLRLLDAMVFLGELQDRIEINVVGVGEDALPVEYRGRPNVNIIGFVNKDREADRFCSLLANSDLGLLLSTAEAGGLSLREFQLAGLGVIAPNVGGSPEWVAPGAGVLVNPTDTPEQIAAILRDLVLAPERVLAMKQAARAALHKMDWRYVISDMISAIDAAAPRQAS